MKNLVIYSLVMLLALLRIDAAVEQDDNRANYQRLERADDKAKNVIAQLEMIEIADVSFEKLSVAAAMSYLNKRVVGEKGGGVINFVIRGNDEVKSIAITRGSLTFAKAVDEICRQGGRVWMIDFNDASGAPILVIKNKDGLQGTGGDAKNTP